MKRELTQEEWKVLTRDMLKFWVSATVIMFVFGLAVGYLIWGGA